MNSLHKRYKTDSSKETMGHAVKFENDANPDGTIPTFYVGRMGGANVEFTKAFDRESKPHRRQMELGILPPELDKAIFRKVFCNAVLKNWENIYDEDGNKLEFNAAVADKFFEGLPDLLADLTKEAQNLENFKAYQLEAEAKN